MREACRAARGGPRMQSNFDASLSLTLGYEGGWSDNPADPGGATMCGITQAVYDDDRDHRRLPRQSVRYSTPAERAAIYRRRYWGTAGCDALPAGVDYALFDFAVNSGVGRAVRTLQRLVSVRADGAMGPQTVAAILRHCTDYGATATTDALCRERMQFLRSLPTFRTFGEGWSHRVVGYHEGVQSGDTGVIDRAYDMARLHPWKTPTLQRATPKTYLARAA